MFHIHKKAKKQKTKKTKQKKKQKTNKQTKNSRVTLISSSQEAVNAEYHRLEPEGSVKKVEFTEWETPKRGSCLKG